MSRLPWGNRTGEGQGRKKEFEEQRGRRGKGEGRQEILRRQVEKGAGK